MKHTMLYVLHFSQVLASHLGPPKGTDMV